MRLSKPSIERLKTATNNLLDGFIWEESIEGHAYWSGVCDSLRKIIDYNETQEEIYCDKCGKIQEVED